MSQILEDIINQFEVVDEGLQAREAQRLFYASKIEVYEEKLKTLFMVETEAIESEQWKQSPIFFGYVTGFRTAIAFLRGFPVKPLQMPSVWHNDPAFDMMLRTFHSVRRDMRRDITRLLWILLDDEMQIRTLLKGAMRAFPPVYKVKLERKRRIEESGANYEEVTNAENIESRWA